jgi:hypothetical protein
LSLTEGHVWGSVSPLLTGSLLLATAAVLTNERRRPDWAPWIGATGLVVVAALAIKAASTPVIWGGADEGLWGVLQTVVTTSPFALLLVLPWYNRTRPLGGPSTWGVVAGLALLLGGAAAGLHVGSEAFESQSSLWVAVGRAQGPVGFGALLVLISLPSRVPPDIVLRSAVAVAAAVVLFGIGYAIDFADRFPINVEWFLLANVSGRVGAALFILAAVGLIRTTPAVFLAGALCVSAVAHITGLTTSGEVDFNLITWAFFVVYGFATPTLAVMCAAIWDGERTAADSQVPASSLA